MISFAKEIQKLFVFKEVNENGRLMYTIEYNLPSSLNFESDVNLDVYKRQVCEFPLC